MSSEQSTTENTAPEAGPVDISQFDLYQLVDLFIMLLTEQAYRYMGLQTKPDAPKTEKDLVKSHVAIDCIIALVDKLEPHLDADEKEHLRRQITDLQISYAEQMK